MLQNGDGRAIGVPVRKALLKLSGVILAQQINPLTQKTPIGEAEHCLSNYRGSPQFWGTDHNSDVSFSATVLKVILSQRRLLRYAS